jgi:hypothetical protein
MTKFCENGHPLDSSWDSCPYCQRTGYQAPAGGVAADRTRIELAAAASVPKKLDASETLVAAPRNRPLVGWLVALTGPQQGEDFRVRDGQNVIGSGGDADIRLQGAGVAARHASLRHRDGAFALTDLDSNTGTLLNEGVASIVRESLKDGDVIRIAEICLKFRSL